MAGDRRRPSRDGLTFQELADEAFKDLLKKRKQPVGAEGGAQGDRAGEGQEAR